MLDSLTVVNQQGNALELPLWETENGYIVKEITGLDPVKATIVTSTMAQIDGESFQNAHLEKRNPVIKLGMDKDHPSFDVRALRRALYSFFMPKSEIQMIFGDSSGVNYLAKGRIESFEAPLFTKDPEATISILCVDPAFYLPEETVLANSTVSTATEFPIDYEGDLEVGIEFQLDIDRTCDGVVLYQTAGGGYIRTIEITYDFIADDVLKISTVKGNKYIRLVREGIEESILYARSSASSWITLQPGANGFRVYAEGAAIPYTVTYKTKFGGL